MKLINLSEAQELNSNGYGIFFSVNSFKEGKRTRDCLERINFWFIDIDEGDKKIQMKKLRIFMTPTAIVETKKGYHAYWRCSEDLLDHVDEYEDILERLVLYFGADKNAMGVNRVLRLPGYYHMKDPANPFMIKKVSETERSYTLSQMNLVLPEKSKIKNLTMTPEILPSDEFWRDVATYPCDIGLEALSGAPELAGDVFELRHVGGKQGIWVNGKRAVSCWIDSDNKIGSHSNGGPTIANWVKWYGYSWDEVANILKKYIPELSPSDTNIFKNIL